MSKSESKLQEKFPLPLDCAEEYFKKAGNVDELAAYIAGFKTARDLRINEPLYSFKRFLKGIVKTKVK